MRLAAASVASDRARSSTRAELSSAILRGVAATGVTLAVLAGEASAAADRDSLVRPGVGIGRISIGMTQAQVQRVLGRRR